MSDEFESKDEFPEDEMPDKEPAPEMDDPSSDGDSSSDDDPSSFKEPADDMDVTDDDKLWALLAYVLTPLIPIIILLMEDKKDRPFLRAHNAQALIWGVVNVAIGILVGWLLCGIPSLILWLIGCYWGWEAYQGKRVEIPWLTGFVKQQGWA